MSFSDWFTTLEAAARARLAAAGQDAEHLIEAVGPVVVADIEQALAQLAGLALEAVIAEAPKLTSGQEKFGNAVGNVVETVEGQGKPILIQDAQMAVQGAYRALQLAVATRD